MAGGGAEEAVPAITAAEAVPTAEIPIEACPADFGATAAEMTARLAEKTREAVRMVDSCLPGLNKTMAKDIRRALKAKKVKILCGDSSGLDGGLTEHAGDGKAAITIYMRARGTQFPLAARVFHELIHAVDPGGKYVLSAKMHARSGFPDPVYGCQFACFQSIGSEDIDRLNNFQRTNGIVIPPLESYDCKGPDCPYLKQHAYLCSTGKPMAGADTLDAAAEQKASSCIVEGLLNECALKACKDFRATVEEATEKTGGDLTPEMGKVLTGLGKRLYRAALEGKKPAELDEADRPVYQAAIKAGFLKKTGARSCLK
jgi:hypothetical protein